MVKIADVAREAGVSTATVSRALNGFDSVHPDLVTRVRTAADKLGYEPNGPARSLRRQRSSVWALVIADIENSFFTSVARGVERVGQRLGYSLLLGNSEEDLDREAKYLRIAEQERVAGVILSPHSAESSIDRLQKAGIPVVLVDRPLEGEVDTVVVDSEAGAFEATTHLLQMGWRRPACVTGPEDVVTAQARARGYRRAMEQAGVAEHTRVVHGPYRSETGSQAVATLLAEGSPPDAFFIANTTLTLGALQALADSGQRLGRDLGLVMFDDAPWAPFLRPPVTVVSQPAQDVGLAAASMLADYINGSQRPSGRIVELQPTLVVRQSSVRHATRD